MPAVIAPMTQFGNVVGIPNFVRNRNAKRKSRVNRFAKRSATRWIDARSACHANRLSAFLLYR